jgi:hypothetical protein
VSSEAEDAVPVWNGPGTEIGEDLARLEREGLAQGISAYAERLTIVSRVGHEEDHAIEAAVALFQDHPPSLRLHVAQNCLGLHADSHRAARHDRVQGPLVSRSGEWYLRSPSETRVENHAETLEQPHVPRVPDRISANERSRAEVQSDNRAEARQLSQRHGGVQTALDAADKRVVHANTAPDVAQTQSGRDSSGTDLEPESCPEPPSNSETALDGPLSGGHVRGVWRATLTWDLPDGFGAGAAPSDRRAFAPRSISLVTGPSSVVWSPSRTNRPSYGGPPVAWSLSGTKARASEPSPVFWRPSRTKAPSWNGSP